MAADSNGNVYASLQYENKVVKLSGGGAEIARFPVGRNPTGLIVDNANGGFLYALNNADNTVSKLKLDGTPVGTFKVAGDGPVAAALYAGVLYVACERSNTLVRLSAADGTALGSASVGARPVWVVIGVTSTKTCTSNYYGGDSMMLASADSSTADSPMVYDGTADCVDCSTQPTAEPAPEESTTVDASTMDGSTTTDPTTAPADTTTADSSPMMASQDSMSYSSVSSSSSGSCKTTMVASVYVACNKANQVWKLSTNGDELGRFNTPRGPFGMALNSRGEILVSCFWDGVVARLSSSGAVLSKTAVGDGPAGVIAYGTTMAVISNGANSVTRLALTDGSFVSRDLVDRSPLIGVSNGSYLWVACTGTGNIARRSL
jgi:hypothetical protein